MSMFFIRYVLQTSANVTGVPKTISQTFFTRYVLKNKEIDQELQRGYMSMFLIGNVLEA
jgi:hypothetical protein